MIYCYIAYWNQQGLYQQHIGVAGIEPEIEIRLPRPGENWKELSDADRTEIDIFGRSLEKWVRSKELPYWRYANNTAYDPYRQSTNHYIWWEEVNHFLAKSRIRCYGPYDFPLYKLTIEQTYWNLVGRIRKPKKK